MKAARFATFLLLILTACYPPRTQESQKKESKTAARINLETEPTTLDPRKARDLNAVSLAHMLFEGLVLINAEEKVELALAESVTISDDLKTYTFHLRPSSWSNGDPVTAEDFVYAWKSVLHPQFPADNAFQFYVIKGAKAAKCGEASPDDVGIQALDARTLQVELEHPSSYFLELIALPAFFPVNKKVAQQNSDWALSSLELVNNGPFSLTHWHHHHQINLTKNATYWDADKITLEEVHFAIVTEETALKMFEKNELDWVGSPLSTLPADALPHLKKQEDFKEKSFLGTFFVRCNTRHPLLSSKKMRHALAIAMNRQELTTHILQGGQVPSTSLVPRSMGLRDAPYFHDGDLEGAKLLFSNVLEEVSFEGKVPELTLIYPNDIRKHLLAQALQQQWELALGIRVKLEAIERKVYFDRVSRQDFDLCLSDWVADFHDPVNFLEVFKYKSASTNNTGWENSDYAHLLEASDLEADPIKRQALLSQCEAILIDAMPIIPIYEHRMLYMVNERLKNVELTSMGIFNFKEKTL